MHNLKTANDKTANETVAGMVEKPGYVFAFLSDLGKGSQINITGNFPVGADRATIDAELDKLTGACNRILAKTIAEQLDEDIKQQLGILSAQEKNLDKIVERHAQPGAKVPDVEKAHVNNSQIEIQRIKDSIAIAKEKLAKAQEESK